MHVKKDKQEIRATAIKKRHQLEAFEQQNRSVKVLCHLNKLLAQLSITKKPGRIGLYSAINNEVIIEQGLALKNWQYYLPKTSSLERGEMVFTPLTEKSKIINSYGIAESATFFGQIAADKLDIIIMPLVAFDNAGTRVGYGGGYYDKALSATKKTVSNKTTDRPVLIGVAFDFQQHNKLPCEAHDIKLDFIVTDTEIINASSSI